MPQALTRRTWPESSLPLSGNVLGPRLRNASCRRPCLGRGYAFPGQPTTTGRARSASSQPALTSQGHITKSDPAGSAQAWHGSPIRLCQSPTQAVNLQVQLSCKSAESSSLVHLQSPALSSRSGFGSGKATLTQLGAVAVWTPSLHTSFCSASVALLAHQCGHSESSRPEDAGQAMSRAAHVCGLRYGLVSSTS